MQQAEQRRYTRVPVVVDCILYRDGAPVDFGRTRDFSRGGVAVHGLAGSLACNTPVVVELHLGGGRGRERFRIPARVTRSSGDRVAAVFTGAEPSTLAALERRARQHAEDPGRVDP